ncbi:hypothetical protein CFIMG_001312RA [Ceratocystis fimbriata CBS 114723]|uniref:Uncharacterized protein n=1 Tax=Ceratocystis fimbriata CBS 114723 TaxID=1035309 RepID=A0A2C5XE60_9PEZI|nr:hypothetical protein CFIMG_001312RA [Ceratocystis fimbriata CBS 114723]
MDIDLPAGQNMSPVKQLIHMSNNGSCNTSYSAEAQKFPPQGLKPPKRPLHNEPVTNVSRPRLKAPVLTQDEAKKRQPTQEPLVVGFDAICRVFNVSNENDKDGECVTCTKAHPRIRFWRLPCLRYRITEVELYKLL